MKKEENKSFILANKIRASLLLIIDNELIERKNENKNTLLINSKPSIHSVNAYFFISKNSINSIRYTYSKMYGLLNKICVYSEDSLVGVVYMTASVQLMEFELLTDYLNDVLRIV